MKANKLLIKIERLKDDVKRRLREEREGLAREEMIHYWTGAIEAYNATLTAIYAQIKDEQWD